MLYHLEHDSAESKDKHIRLKHPQQTIHVMLQIAVMDAKCHELNSGPDATRKAQRPTKAVSTLPPLGVVAVDRPLATELRTNGEIERHTEEMSNLEKSL